MAAHLVVLSVGLLLCLVGFVLVFELNEGETSSVTAICKRRLMAVWVLSSLDLTFLSIWRFVQGGFTWKSALTPALAGLILSVVGFLIIDRLPEAAPDDAHSALSKVTRWSQLGLFLSVIGCLLYLLIRLPEAQASVPRVLGLTLITLAVTVAVAGLVYFFIKEKPEGKDADPMPIITRRLLAWYLLFFGACLLILLWRIASIEFPNAGLKIETQAPAALPAAVVPPAGSSATEGATANERPPVLQHLFSQVSLAAVPVVYIIAYGENFTPESKLRFNQQPQPTVFVDASRIQAPLDQATIDSVDPIAIDVITKDSATGKDQITGTIPITVQKEHAKDKVLGLQLDLTRELQLLLLAILAGALGSFVHALKSFGDFVGNRTLTASWFWWYITRPFLGAALAVIFYAVLRGGFMAGTPADAKAVNQFGVIAVGALVGMFADKASDKLADIFDTLFKGADNRSGKLAAPVIDQLVPATIPSGSNPTELKIKGDRLGTVSQVKFDNVAHSLGTVSDKEVTVPLSKDDLAKPRTIKISVVGNNGESPTKDLQITELA